MITTKLPFNPNTAQNGEDYMHRTFGHCVYIGKSPSDNGFYVVWSTPYSAFKVVMAEALTREVECEEKWVNLTVDLYNGGLIPSKLFNTKELAEVSGRHTIEYVCTVPIMAPKV